MTSRPKPRGAARAHSKTRALWVAVLLALLASEKPARAERPSVATTMSLPSKERRPLHPPAIFQLFDVPPSQTGVKRSLPQTNVTAIVQDPQGFLWFGTQGGLARFDGNGMRHYLHSPSDPKSLADSHITSLAIDRQGALWIGTELGLDRYDRVSDSFVHFVNDAQNPSSLGAGAVSAVNGSGEDGVLVGLGSGGLELIDVKTNAVRHLLPPGTLSSPVSSILRTRANGMVWIGTREGGLFRVLNERGELEEFRHNPDDPNTLSADTINILLEDRDGNIWVGTESGGLNRIDSTARTITRYRLNPSDRNSLPDDRVLSLLEDRRGRLWVGTKNGASILERPTGRFKRYVRDPYAAETTHFPRFVAEIFEDRTGKIWFGDDSGGDSLKVFDDSWASFGLHKPLNVTPTGFTEAADGTLWIASFESGLIKVDRKSEELTIYAAVPQEEDKSELVQLGEHWLPTAYVDRRGVIWLGRSGLGMVAFNPKTELARLYPADPSNPRGLLSDHINRIIEDADGNLWLATWGGGLTRFNPKTEEFSHYLAEEHDPQSLSSNYLYTVMVDRTNPNALWLGTGDSGLMQFNKSTGECIRFVHDPKDPKSLSHNGVLSVHQSDDGTLWVGTYGKGLNHLNPKDGTFEHFSTSNGLPNDTIYGIVEDDAQNLWMTTNGGGLAVFNMKTRVSSAYKAQDGLQGNEFAQGAYFKTGKGELLVGGGGGFNLFRPTDLEFDDSKSLVALTTFQVFGKELPLSTAIWNQPEVELGYSQSVFSIGFGALAYAGPGGHRFSYRLDGVHDEWIETQIPMATYTKLDGGNYVFRVRPEKRHGGAPGEETTLQIHVDPPPWKTWWAYTIYAMILGLAGFAYYRHQAQKIARLQAENRLQAVERDLELTSVVQSWFLPARKVFSDGRVEVLGFLKAADKCSGDWWWHEPRPNGRHWIIVGDVTGHGPAPAILTASVATAFRVHKNDQNARLSDLFAMLHEEIHSFCGGEYTMTITAIEMDSQTGEVEILLAGGMPVALLQTGKKASYLQGRGTPLGSGGDLIIGSKKHQMKPRDRVLVFTDGIPEHAVGGGAEGKMLGARWVLNSFQATHELGLEAASQAFVANLDKDRQGAKQDDDVTFVMVEWHPDQAEQRIEPHPVEIAAQSEATVPGKILG